eukprot:gb/GECH01014956.1/.p1 GENE.gb/GECH01014956.1/~~gb/GECH01014956.1/.p1  ORF type:complete len:371 (+),score=55.58 gb/GECH01014956.1/:1-1113(+)
MKSKSPNTINELFFNLESKTLVSIPLIKYCQTLLEAHGFQYASDLKHPHRLNEVRSQLGIPTHVCNALAEELNCPEIQSTAASSLDNHSALQNMNANILKHIFKFIQFGEILVIESQVCRKWRKLVFKLKLPRDQIPLILNDMFLFSLQIRMHRPLLRVNLSLLRLITIRFLTHFGGVNPDLVNQTSPSDDAILSVISLFNRVRALRLSQCSLHTNTLCSIIMHSQNLEELDLSYCNNVNDQVIKSIGVRGHRLKYVNLSGCRNISDSAIHFMTSSCSNIQTLLLFDSEISDKSLQSIAFNIPQIKQIGVTSTHISQSGIQVLLQECSNLDLQYKTALTKLQRLLPSPHSNSVPGFVVNQPKTRLLPQLY